MTKDTPNAQAVASDTLIIEDGKEVKPVVHGPYSTVMPFNEVKDLLSEKPLRRPNRTRPIEKE